MMAHKSILLIISGGIAAYKSLELIRLLKKSGASVRCILTKSGAEFVTPMSVAALSENPVYTDLFSLKDESEMGHIRLSREADLIVIAPASANMIAKMAHGLADDLATTTLLAANKPVLIAPAMNHMMWEHPATQSNIQTLTSRGVRVVGPEQGDMACGEYGYGRMSEPSEIVAAILSGHRTPPLSRPLEGRKALVTSGPTYEPIDPVRFIGNRSSGKQGHAIAIALRDAGADVTLVTGPVALPDPGGIKTLHVQTTEEMLETAARHLPADIAVCAAAPSDWRVTTPAPQKLKKQKGKDSPSLQLSETPDILATISTHKQRPALVIGFAAETENLLQHAQDKRTRKECDWILANDVSGEKVFGADENHVYLVTDQGIDEWPATTKEQIGVKLADNITAYFKLLDRTGKQDAAE